MSLFDPEEGIIELIVGKAGTGKTSMVLTFAKKFERPCVIDTEGISVQRIKQIGVMHARIARVTSFEEQHIAIMDFKEECDFLAVDSLVMLYRLYLAKNAKKANAMLAEQMAKLASIAHENKIPVVVTGHVYRDEKGLHIVSGDIASYWAKKIVYLEKEGKKRKAVLIKHPYADRVERRFKISEKGIEF